MIKKLVEFIRGLDLTTMLMTILAGLLPGWAGFLAKLLGRPIVQTIENEIDNGVLLPIENAEDSKASDAVIDQAKQDHISQNQKAQSDEDIDASFRDSLR